MRWFVEVAEGSYAAAERWVVEAAHWQPALKEARTLRGEAGETSGFSVELLEDGFRAIDPSTLVRYVLRQAPEETPLSKPITANGHAAASHSPVSHASLANAEAVVDLERKVASTPPAEPIALTRPAAAPVELTIPKAPTPPVELTTPKNAVPPVDRVTPKVAAHAEPAISKVAATSAEAVVVPKIAPRPVESVSPPRSVAPPVSARPAAPIPAVTPSKSAPSVVAPSASASEPLPPAELLYEREEDASASSPLTYRESAWLVPEGTSFDAAARLLMGTFEGVRAAIAGVKSRKLVNMAVFDHRFEGKPQRPPLVTLAWKDWQDTGQGPELRRPSERPPSMNPPAPRSVPPPASTSAPSVVASGSPAPVADAHPAVVVELPSKPLESTAVAAMPVEAPAPVAQPSIAAAPVVPPPSEATSAPMTALAPEAPPEPPAARALDQPASAEPIPARHSSTPSPRRRLVGEELIADLFEAMHDLHFLRDPLEGADFVLSLVMDKLPSQVGLVHFFDIDAREFVVVRASGPGAQKLRGSRTSEKEPVVAEAMRKRRAVVIADTSDEEGKVGARWAQLDLPARSIVCAPVELAGRFLGLLELCNPRDETAFAEGDGHALTYIGEQFAEFLGSRTVVLDRKPAAS